jgi:hypothetical protein
MDCGIRSHFARYGFELWLSDITHGFPYPV